ncbi:MAG: hypothetical protein ACI4I9_05825 [Porcipelethomonas sp.]
MMRARAKTYTRKEMEWLCEEVMEDVENCVNSNGIVTIIALIRHTGWGKKRITDFIKTLNATMDEYHRHNIDGVFDYMAEQELSSAGIELDQLLPKTIPFKQQLKKSRNEKLVDVDYKTAKALHSEFTAIGNYIKANKIDEVTK